MNGNWRQMARWTGSFVCLMATVVAALLSAGPASAATLPATGALRTTGGGPVVDGLYVVVFRLYDAPDAQQPIWEELQSDVSVALGSFHVSLGAKRPGPRSGSACRSRATSSCRACR
jgi:hypothetical protein